MNRFLGGAAIFAALVAIWGSGATQQVAAWMGGRDQPIAQINNDTTDIPPAEGGDADDETVEQAGRLARRQGDEEPTAEASPDAVVKDEEDDDTGEDLGEEIADEATEETPTPAPSPPQPAVPALW